MTTTTKENIKSAVLVGVFLLLQVLILLGMFLCGRRSVNSGATSTLCDTIRYVDTVKFYKPTPKQVLLTRYETVRLPVAEFGREDNFMTNDTIQADSISVVVPITQSIYQDSTYTAWISGYHTSLDSIYIANQREVITISQSKPPNRWHLGVSAGYGLTPKGIQPWVGIGLTYSIVDF